MTTNKLREKAREVAERHFPSAPPGSPLVYQRENAAKSIAALAEEYAEERGSEMASHEVQSFFTYACGVPEQMPNDLLYRLRDYKNRRRKRLSKGNPNG